MATEPEYTVERRPCGGPCRLDEPTTRNLIPRTMAEEAIETYLSIGGPQKQRRVCEGDGAVDLLRP